MSQTVIFVIGTLVFALTVWGTVMAGGHWLEEIARFEDEPAPHGPGPVVPPDASPVDT